MPEKPVPHRILLVVGDASETLDTLSPYYRLQEAGFEPVVAAAPHGAVGEEPAGRVAAADDRDPTAEHARKAAGGRARR